MNNRKIAALRNLAERPGTAAEGELARELLNRLESKGTVPTDEAAAWATFEGYLKSDISSDEYLERMREWVQRTRAQPLPTHWRCACGANVAVGSKCEEEMAHLLIQQAIREKFSPGDRVLYNYHAYEPNCPGRVASYVKLKQPNGSYPWAWLSVKFDHLRQVRQVPIYSSAGWHLTKVPTIPQNSTTGIS